MPHEAYALLRHRVHVIGQARESLCLHLNVHTTWWLKTDTPNAHLDGRNNRLLHRAYLDLMNQLLL